MVVLLAKNLKSGRKKHPSWFFFSYRSLVVVVKHPKLCSYTFTVAREPIVSRKQPSIQSHILIWNFSLIIWASLIAIIANLPNLLLVAILATRGAGIKAVLLKEHFQSCLNWCLYSKWFVETGKG